MIDERIQKTVIPYTKLPFSTPTGYYYARFRVIISDGTIFSNWTTKTFIAVQPISEIVGPSYNPNYKVTFDGKTAKIAWDLSSKLKLDIYDVYVRWDSEDWAYVTTTRSNSCSLPVPANKEFIEFWVQAPTTAKTTSITAKLFQTTLQADGFAIQTLTAVDGGSPYS